MKPIKKRWLGFSLASTLIALGAFSTPAMAADYSGNCAFIPNHVTGNATINDSACVIDTGATLIVDGTLTIDADSVDVKSEIQSVGKVTIRTNGGGELKLRKKASSQNNDILLQSPQNRIDTKGLEAGNSVQVDAGLNGAEGSTWDIKVDGQIIVNKLQTSPTNPNIHGNVLLRAAGPISTKTIKTEGDLGTASVKSGGVQIEAFRNGAGSANASEFVIGGTGNANGVNGNIITQSSTGGGTSPSFVNGGLYVTMGGSNSTGNIRVADMTAIKVRATQSRSGFIIFNAQQGTIFLPAGNLNASGDTTNNAGAGLIYLLAKTLDTQPGTIISANQTETAAGTGHQIFICVETVKYRGNGTDGLKVLNDGNGGGGFFSLVNISPYGYLVPGMLTSNVNQMSWNFSLGSAELAMDRLLTLDGTEGNAPLILRADGNTAAVNVSGYPLNFSGGNDVLIRSRGQNLHRINVGFFGNRTNKTGLTVDITGNFVLDANGKDGPGGIIQVKADQTLLAPAQASTDPSSGKVIIRADGPDTGNGDGGTILFDTSSVVLTGRAALSADGAPNGNGNAVITSDLLGSGPQAIKFYPGSNDVLLGGGAGQFFLTARGGLSGGNAGGIIVQAPSAEVTLQNRLAVDASAPSETGAGGGILLDAQQVKFVAGNATNAAVISTRAKGGADTGTGGRIIVKNATKRNGQQFLAVTSSMNVDGGDNLATSAFDGSIEINTVPCRQWKHPNFLGSYWNCVHPNTQGEFDFALDRVESSLTEPFNRNLLVTNKTQVFIHENTTKHASFFLDDDAANSGGLTFREPRSNIINAIHVSVFTTCENCLGNTGLYTIPAANFTEILGHEIGHAVDLNRLVNQESTLPFYISYLRQDNMNLDFASIGVDEASSIRRLPCSPTPDPAGGNFPGIPPFQLVEGFLAGQSQPLEPLCVNGALNPAVADLVPPGTLNSIIMRGFASRNYDTSEWYAQTFAFVAFTSNPLFAAPFEDGVMENGHFTCTVNYALSMSSGNGAVPSYCSNAVPQWYRDLQNSQFP